MKDLLKWLADNLIGMTDEEVREGFPGISPTKTDLYDPEKNWTLQIKLPFFKRAIVIPLPKGSWAGIVSPGGRWGSVFLSHIQHALDDRNFPGITIIENMDGGVVTVLFSVVTNGSGKQLVYAVVEQERPRVKENYAKKAKDLRPRVETAPARGFAADSAITVFEVFAEEVQEAGLANSEGLELIDLGGVNTNNAWFQLLGPERGLRFMAAEIPETLLIKDRNTWRFDPEQVEAAEEDEFEPIEDTFFAPKSALLASWDGTTFIAITKLEAHLEAEGRATGFTMK